MIGDEMRFKARIKSRAQEEGIRPQVAVGSDPIGTQARTKQNL